MTETPSSVHAVTLGVDTHVDIHVAAVLDHLGRLVGTHNAPTTEAGYRALEVWALSFGPLGRVGIEGTGSFGAGLARWLRARGHVVVEVERPTRQCRNRKGKTDPVDAEAAARAVMAGTATAIPKAGTGEVEMVRVVSVAYRSAMKARTQTANQIHSILITAPDCLRARFRGQTVRTIVSQAARLRPGTPTTPEGAAKLVLRSLAGRYRALSVEATELDGLLDRLVAKAAPDLLALPNLGPKTAGALIVAAGDNPERLRSEAAFAKLCGVAPIPANSGRTQQRHRLSRAGNRQANWALHMMALGRMVRDTRTHTYIARKRAEGKTKREAIRCLKRHLAREVFHVLPSTVSPPT